jgi:uncharacterized protein YihD (DUF1040 family)
MSKNTRKNSAVGIDAPNTTTIPSTQSTTSNTQTSTTSSSTEEKKQILSQRDYPNMPKSLFDDAKAYGIKWGYENTKLNMSNISHWNQFADEVNRFIMNAVAIRESFGASDYDMTPPPININTNIMSSPGVNRVLGAQFQNIPGSGSSSISNVNPSQTVATTQSSSSRSFTQIAQPWNIPAILAGVVSTSPEKLNKTREWIRQTMQTFNSIIRDNPSYDGKNTLINALAPQLMSDSNNEIALILDAYMKENSDITIPQILERLASELQLKKTMKETTEKLSSIKAKDAASSILFKLKFESALKEVQETYQENRQQFAIPNIKEFLFSALTQEQQAALVGAKLVIPPCNSFDETDNLAEWWKIIGRVKIVTPPANNNNNNNNRNRSRSKSRALQASVQSYSSHSAIESNPFYALQAEESDSSADVEGRSYAVAAATTRAQATIPPKPPIKSQNTFVPASQAIPEAKHCFACMETDHVMWNCPNSWRSSDNRIWLKTTAGHWTWSNKPSTSRAPVAKYVLPAGFGGAPTYNNQAYHDPREFYSAVPANVLAKGLAQFKP